MQDGTLMPELRELAPAGERRISANPHANGGLLRKPLELPDFRDYAVQIRSARQRDMLRRRTCSAQFLRDVMRRNMTSFRVFGPDETASNRLQAIYAAVEEDMACRNTSRRMPMAANSAPDGRVMEMLSEHTLEGWFEGYVLTGRHGFFTTYEAFVHIIDSMFNQHAKWLEKSKLEAGLARAQFPRSTC